MPSVTARDWFPDGAPDKIEVAIAVVLLFDVAYDFYTGEPVVWSWFVGGFVACVLALGPVAASPVGSQVDTWFRDIGVAGRALVIIAFAVVVWMGYEFAGLPPKRLSSAASGIFLAVGFVIGVRLFSARTVG
ncbi:hypothetical protein BV210_07350 [Halorientalis sp. IM1011]|uniref:hypothetical protein n=1 Tax=Halorientalis sp. IM1011 TaxID=1932360 RepID=UPI00097CC439|nr:hypothetical protein [Halorientalis sp. IM1011]AQL42536.1 hypothetical protein BV210_07350 [Halorientalis sp. IM1011]